MFSRAPYTTTAEDCFELYDSVLSRVEVSRPVRPSEKNDVSTSSATSAVDVACSCAGNQGCSSDVTGGQGYWTIVEPGSSMKDSDTRYTERESVLVDTT